MGPPCCELELILDPPWEAHFRSAAELVRFLSIVAIYAPGMASKFIQKLAAQDGLDDLLPLMRQYPSLVEVLR